MGDDVCWVGNECGLGCEMEWSVIVLIFGMYVCCEEQNKVLGVKVIFKDLGGCDMLVNVKEFFWYFFEVDVLICLGWFYYQQEDNQVKSFKYLIDIYFKFVGYNLVLLFNIFFDQCGCISDVDVNCLKEFVDYCKEIFVDNCVKGGLKVWIVWLGDMCVYQLKLKLEINVVMLCEDILKG